MAPQNKRANVSKAAAPAKKVKVQHDDAEDPFSAQLAPILSALSASAKHSAVCDMLRAALPHCLGEVSTERHSFQTRMLDLTASALKSLEETARTDLAEAETIAEKFRSEAITARSNFEVAKGLGEAKKAESDAKLAEVEKLGGEVKAAKLEVQTQVQKKEAFLESKASLATEQEAFQTVLTEMWEPLKACKFLSQQWRKRDKCITDMVEKLAPLSLDASLVEGLQVALKLKLDQRSAFAQRALSFTEDAFEQHKEKFVQRLAATGDEEIACDKAVAEAEAKLAVVQAEHAKEDKESDELQNAWVELDTQSQEAESTATAADAEVQNAAEDVEAQRAELEAALGFASSFAALRDPPAVVEQPEVVAEEVPEEVAEEVPQPMETEVPVAVAVA